MQSLHALFEQSIESASLVEIINEESMLKELVQKIGPRAKLRFLVKKMQQNAGELHQAYGLSPAGPTSTLDPECQTFSCVIASPTSKPDLEIPTFSITIARPTFTPDLVSPTFSSSIASPTSTPDREQQTYACSTFTPERQTFAGPVQFVECLTLNCKVLGSNLTGVRSRHFIFID